VFLAPLIQLFCTDLSSSTVLRRENGLSLKVVFCCYGSLSRFLLLFASRNTDTKEKNKFLKVLNSHSPYSKSVCQAYKFRH